MLINKANAQVIDPTSVGALAVNGGDTLFQYGVLGVVCGFLMALVVYLNHTHRMDDRLTRERQDKKDADKDDKFITALDKQAQAIEKQADSADRLTDSIKELMYRTPPSA